MRTRSKASPRFSRNARPATAEGSRGISGAGAISLSAAGPCEGGGKTERSVLAFRPASASHVAAPASTRSCVDVLTRLRAGDSHYWRCTSASENVQRSIDVAIMYATATTAPPCSYSQAFQPARAAARMARRTGYGKKRFGHFFELRPVRNRFIAELVSEGQPRCVIDAFRHLGFGVNRAAHTNLGMPPCGGAPYLLGLKPEVSRSKI
jgi:hypothetical protein